MKIVKNISILGFGLIAVMSGNAQSQVQTAIGTNNRLISNANSKAQAMSQLSSQALGKIESSTLSKMLESESNDFIVMFEDVAPKIKPSNSTLSEYLSSKKNTYAIEKKNFMGDMSTNAVELISEYSHLPMAFVRTKNTAALIKLLNHPRVLSVVRDVKANLSGIDNDSGPLIHQPGAVAAGITGAGTTVAVIDDGLNYSRSEFGSCTAVNTPQSCRVSAAVSFTSGVPFTSTVNAAGVGAHGSNVAGIAAGIAPATKIAALDVFGGTSSAKSSAIINALNWVMSNKVGQNIVAVNLSAGFDGTTCTDIAPIDSLQAIYQTAINGVRSAGVLPITASGNEASTSRISIPSCSVGAISVGAVLDGHYASDIVIPKADGSELCRNPASSSASNVVACFSNSSNKLTMFAPGIFITAGGYSLGGTSQAAPHVAGAVALLRSSVVAPGESLAQIEARLTRPDWTVTDTRNGTSLTKPRLTVMGAIANQHFYVVQQIFVAYFGRPADVTGMTYWANQLGRGAAPTTLSALSSAYSTNPVVKSMLDSFSTSAESGRLYPGTTSDFVTAVYRNLFNRAPDTSGLNYWVGEINSGRITKAQAAVIILLGAQNTSLGQDITTSTRKVEAANRFTTSIDITAENANYSGTNDVALARGRSTLAQVTNTTNVAAFQSTIDQNLYYISLGL